MQEGSNDGCLSPAASQVLLGQKEGDENGKVSGEGGKGEGEKDLLSKQYLHIQAQWQSAKKLAIHGAAMYHRQLFNPVLTHTKSEAMLKCIATATSVRQRLASCKQALKLRGTISLQADSERPLLNSTPLTMLLLYGTRETKRLAKQGLTY